MCAFKSKRGICTKTHWDFDSLLSTPYRISENTLILNSAQVVSKNPTAFQDFKHTTQNFSFKNPIRL